MAGKAGDHRTSDSLTKREEAAGGSCQYCLFFPLAFAEDQQKLFSQKWPLGFPTTGPLGHDFKSDFIERQRNTLIEKVR